MSKTQQKMTLNVRRRANTAAAPPAANKAQIEAFAGAINGAAPTVADVKAAASPQIIRDAFTMPAEDHRLFAEIQKKCLAFGTVVSKSEILRAGLKYLADLDEEKLEAVVKTVPKVKIGRPAARDK